MKAKEVVQCMVPRALFGVVRNTSKSVYSSNSQLLLSRPSVSGAYLRSTQEKQLLAYCFQYVAAVVFYIGISCTIFSMKHLMSFLSLVTVVLFLVCSRCFFIFLPSNNYVRQNLRRTERKYQWADSIKCQNNFLESVHPTDSVVFRTCQLVVSSLFGQSQSFIFDRFFRQIL